MSPVAATEAGTQEVAVQHRAATQTPGREGQECLPASAAASSSKEPVHSLLA